MLYEQAYLHYLHHDFKRAYETFWQLVQNYPGHSTSYGSAYLILDVLNRRKDYPKLVLACQKFLTTHSFSKPEFRTEVSDILRHAELKRIQTIEDKGSYKEAAYSYVEYTKQYGPQDPVLFEKALYNASVDYTKAGMLLEALDAQEQFLRKFQKSTLRENMVLQVAKTYENLANFEKAAYYFELFANSYTSNAQAKNALRISALYYWGAGNSKKAEQLMKGYLASYPKDAKVVEADLIDVYEYQGMIDQEINEALKERAVRGVPISDYVALTVRVAELYGRKNGQISGRMMEEALKVAEKFQKDLMQTPRGVETLSKVLFWFANQKEDVFNRIKLVLPQKQLEINLQRKLALVKELEKEYTRIASLAGGEWGVGAIYKTASAYRALAQEVQQAPVPGDLTAEQLEMYRTEVNKQMVKPFNEKAAALVAQCLDKAQEFTILSSWTPKCYALGGEMDATRYPVVRTFYLPPVQVSVMVPKSPQAKIALGNYKTYVFPYDSPTLFHQAGADRMLASIAPARLPLLYEGSDTMNDGSRAIPSPITYQTLAEGRKDVLTKAYNSEKPADSRKSSFAFLNLLRLGNPAKAISSIREAISRDPSNTSLHNLLALSYMDSGNFPAAKVTWLSLIARGEKQGAISNNLGVVAALEGNESTAIDYFHEAATTEDNKEALTNLGFIALKYRNGFEAKKYFTKALTMQDEDVTAHVGLAVACLQNKELDTAKDNLVDAVKRFKADPYGRLNLTYYVLDIDKDNGAAQQILNDTVQAHPSLENDVLFREAIQESKRVAGSTTKDSGALPGLGTEFCRGTRQNSSSAKQRISS